MSRPRVLALVMAGGEGGRMEVLTDRRAKPALPFAGVYRLIDLPLSNLRNSGIDDVWIVAQYEVQTVVDVVAGGRPWDLDRTHGGLRFITPEQRRDLEEEAGWHEGNADAIHQTRDHIRELHPDVVLVLSADHVYRLDFSEVVAAHLDREGDLTIVSTRVPIDQAPHHGVVVVDDDGRVTGFGTTSASRRACAAERSSRTRWCPPAASSTAPSATRCWVQASPSPRARSWSTPSSWPTSRSGGRPRSASPSSTRAPSSARALRSVRTWQERCRPRISCWWAWEPTCGGAVSCGAATGSSLPGAAGTSPESPRSRRW